MIHVWQFAKRSLVQKPLCHDANRETHLQGNSLSSRTGLQKPWQESAGSTPTSQAATQPKPHAAVLCCEAAVHSILISPRQMLAFPYTSWLASPKGNSNDRPRLCQQCMMSPTQLQQHCFSQSRVKDTTTNSHAHERRLGSAAKTMLHSSTYAITSQSCGCK